MVINSLINDNNVNWVNISFDKKRISTLKKLFCFHDKKSFSWDKFT